MYDAKGNLLRTLYADGTETRTTYDALGRVVWQSDRYKSATTYNTTTGVYSNDNTTPSLATETLYDSLGRAVGTLRAGGVIISIGSQSFAGLSGMVSEPIDGVNSSYKLISATSTLYDAAGQAVESDSQIVPDGRVNADGTPGGSIGVRTGTVYNVDGSTRYTGVLQANAPVGWYAAADPTQYFQLDSVDGHRQFTTNLYNQLDTSTGNLWSGMIYNRSIDAGGNHTDTYADIAGRAQFTVYEDGSFTQMLYSDGDRAITSGTHPNLPNGLSLPADLTVPAGGSETISIGQRKGGDAPVATLDVYDVAGRLVDVYEQTSAGVYSHWTYVYDSSGNEIYQVTPTSLSNYQVAGMPDGTASQLPGVGWTVYAYDGQGNKIFERLPQGEEQTWSFDAYGNQMVHKVYGQHYNLKTNAAASATTVDYYDTGNDGHGGRLLGEFRYSSDYTPTATTASQLPGVGWTVYAYDGQGDKIFERLPQGEEQTWSFDAYGNQLVHKVYGQHYNLKTNAAASATTVDYYDTSGDGHGGRLLGEFRYSFDYTPTATTVAGASVTGYAEKTLYKYDDTANPAAGELGTGGVLEVDDYALVNSAMAETAWTKYTYDSITGQEATVATAEGIVNYVYDPATGRLTETWTGTSRASAGTDTLYGYDQQGRLASVSEVRLDGLLATAVPGGTRYGPSGSNCLNPCNCPIVTGFLSVDGDCQRPCATIHVRKIRERNMTKRQGSSSRTTTAY